MIKKEYLKPTTKVVQLQYQSHILTSSLTSIKSTGLNTENDLTFDDDGGDQEDAW